MFYSAQEHLTIANSMKYHFKQRKALGSKYISHVTTILNVQCYILTIKRKSPVPRQ